MLFYSPITKEINLTHAKILRVFQDHNAMCSNGYWIPTMHSTVLFNRKL